MPPTLVGRTIKVWICLGLLGEPSNDWVQSLQRDCSKGLLEFLIVNLGHLRQNMMVDAFRMGILHLTFSRAAKVATANTVCKCPVGGCKLVPAHQQGGKDPGRGIKDEN